MKLKNNKYKQLLSIGGMAIIGLVLFSQASFATFITADFGVGGPVFLQVDGIETREWAGSIKIDVDDSQRIAMCVDLFTLMNTNQTYGTNFGMPSSIGNGGRVAWLLDNELPLLNSDATLAGLQLAVWDIVHDNGNGFSYGRIQASTQQPTDVIALNAANALLALSAGKSATDGTVYYNYNLFDGRKVQTLMGAGPGILLDQSSGVPEPQSLAMIAIGGLAGLWLKLRHK